MLFLLNTQFVGKLKDRKVRKHDVATTISSKQIETPDYRKRERHLKIQRTFKEN